jgi:hypothetical protein
LGSHIKHEIYFGIEMHLPGKSKTVTKPLSASSFFLIVSHHPASIEPNPISFSSFPVAGGQVANLFHPCVSSVVTVVVAACCFLFLTKASLQR